jgi:nitroreductase
VSNATPPFALDEIDRLLTTTKAVRRRLDLARPVDRPVVLECIRLATYAPNASNAQEWRWILVDDPELRRRVAEEYRRVAVPAVTALLDAKLARGDEDGARISRSILYLADHLAEVPVLVIPCFDLRAGTSTPFPQISRMFASIYPAVWSFQLALRSRGLGSVFTTAHTLDEPAVGAILGIPDSWTQTCMIPVAHTTGGDFTPSARRDVDELVAWNGWDGEA